MRQNLIFKSLSNAIGFCLLIFVFQICYISSSNADQSNVNPNQNNSVKAQKQAGDAQLNQDKLKTSKSGDTTIENSMESEEEKKSTSSNYSNLIAAFVAAVLTFLATQYNESRNWQRKKVEFLRDKQFTKVVESAKLLNSIAKACDEIYARLVFFEEKVGPELNYDSILHVELNSFIIDKIEILKKSQFDFNENILELKLLKVHESKLNEIKNVRDSALAVTGILEEYVGNKKPISSKKIEVANRKINNDTTTFVENALQAISG